MPPDAWNMAREGKLERDNARNCGRAHVVDRAVSMGQGVANRPNVPLKEGFRRGALRIRRNISEAP